MMKRSNWIQGGTYREYVLQQSQKTKSGYHGEILEALAVMLKAMTFRRWNFIFALTLKFPEVYPLQTDNTLLVAFLKWFAERLGYKVPYHYLWVREQDRGVHPHFHIIFIVDGDRIYSGWRWMLTAEEIWAKVLDIPSAAGLLEASDPEQFPLEHAPAYKRSVSSGMMIDNRAVDVAARRQEVYYWLCYFAKISTKCAGTGYRSFGTSRF